jgi:hypothetical protein
MYDFYDDKEVNIDYTTASVSSEIDYDRTEADVGRFLDIDDDEDYRVPADRSFAKSVVSYGMDSEFNSFLRKKPKRVPKAQIKGWEVGDDRIDVSTNPFKLLICIAVQDLIMEMKTSPEDTFISNKYWNFCEVTNLVPCSELGSYAQARKTNSFDKIEFVDAPVMRIVIDCQKGDRSHSSTVPGKASMMASRTSANCIESRATMQLASFLQDGCLRTSRASEPKYLPREVGGSGCSPLFGNYRNTYTYMMTYRGGNYHRLYGSAVKELREVLRQYEI